MIGMLFASVVGIKKLEFNMNRKTLLAVTEAFVGLIATYDRSDRSDPDLNNKDQDQDQDQDQDRIERSPYSGLLLWFRDLCFELGVDLVGYDLTSVVRSISWIRENYSKIAYPRAYILKVLGDARKCEVFQKRIPVGFRSSQVSESAAAPAADSDKIFGVDRSEVLEKVAYYDARMHSLLIPKLGESIRRLYPDFSAVEGNSLGLNILTAYAIKEGLL